MYLWRINGHEIKFFSEKTGVKYPYEKYAQTVARDFNGGMENISATTQYDAMIHDARSDSHRMDSLQSHELAHQWFGDYVTARNWSDIWLNESFATYFQALWDEHSLGHDDFLYLDVKNNQDQYFAAWVKGIRRPIVTKNYANPDAVFDTYTYPRGAAVLHMLRQNLGEQNWWRAINYYLTKYAHQHAWIDFLRMPERQARDFAGKAGCFKRFVDFLLIGPHVHQRLSLAAAPAQHQHAQTNQRHA